MNTCKPTCPCYKKSSGCACGCNNPNSLQTKMDIEIGELVLKAWKEGLWHSESEMGSHLKEYMLKRDQAIREMIAGEVEKVLINDPSRESDEYDEGRRSMKRDVLEIIKKIV